MEQNKISSNTSAEDVELFPFSSLYKSERHGGGVLQQTSIVTQPFKMILRLSWNQKVQNSANKKPPLNPVPKHLNQVQNLDIRKNTTFPSTC